MSNFTYENQGTNTFLVYEVQPEDVIDTMSIGMLTNNKIAGLASTIYTQLDTARYIKFNVSAKIPVKQFFTGIVNKKRLLGVLNGVVNALLAAEEYMLNPDTIVLDMEYIFADVSTCETVLICLPIENSSIESADVGMFFKNIIFSTQFDQGENCSYVASIINYLNSNPVLSLVDFKTMLESLQREADVVEQSKIMTATSVPHQGMPVQQVQNTVPRPQPVQSTPVMQQPVQQTPQMSAQPPVQKQMAIPNAGQPVRQQAVPQPQQRPVQVPPQQVQNQSTGEKEISFFYLMQHYNKENAAAYKAQKEAKKANKAAQVPDKKPDKKKDKKKNKKEPVMQQTSFAVPGAPQNGFAVPGQAEPLAREQMPQQQMQSNPVHQMQQNHAAQQQVSRQQQVQSQMQQALTPNPTYIPPQQMVQQPANFGETTVLNGGVCGETTVLNTTILNQQTERKPYLIRMKNNEKIMIDKPVFRIGKEKSYVDYFISDNTAISRSHVNIVTRDGEYFVVDTNSTNHTYINGQMIQSNVEAKIDHNMQLRLANEEFEFRIY